MRPLRLFAVAAGLMLALSSCEMTVRLVTHLEADGSGTFAIGMLLDKELRDQLEGSAAEAAGTGLEPIEELFDGLEARGWVVDRSEPTGGLALEARRSFEDPDGFEAVLAELSSARTGEATGFGDVSFELDYSPTGSFLRRGIEFRGVVDTSSANLTEDQQALQEALGQLFRLEIRAELPGSVTLTDGEGIVGEDVVVWRPVLGSRVEFGAAASSVRMGSLLAIVVPAVLLLGLIGWFALGRRKPDVADDGTFETADERSAPVTIVHQDQMLAIKLEAYGARKATNGAETVTNGSGSPDEVTIDLTAESSEEPVTRD